MANGNGSIATVHAYAPIERVSYFYGQLLTERDLRAEQDYHVMLRRLMQREMLGTGTVAGLRLEAVGTMGTIAVRPGLALDPDGRELLLAADTTIDAIPPVVPDQSSSYLPSGPTVSASDIATALSTEWGASIGEADVDLLWDYLHFFMPDDVDAGSTPPAALPMLRDLLARLGDAPDGFHLDDGVILLEYLFRRIIGIGFIGLRYRERGSLPSPSVLGGTCCEAEGCQPARLQEGVDVIATETFPASPDFSLDERVTIERCFENDQNPYGVTAPPTPPPPPWAHDRDKCLGEAVLSSWRGLPDMRACPPQGMPIVTLGAILWPRLARLDTGDPRLLFMDQAGARPLAAGAPALRALVESLTQMKTLLNIPPRIQMIDPAQRGRLVFGATDTEVRAKSLVTSRVKLDDQPWSVTFYPADGTGPFFWDSSGSNDPPAGLTIAIDTPIQPPAGSTDPSELDLLFTATSGVLADYLTPGAYLWRLNPLTMPSASVQAQETGEKMQGQPRTLYLLGLGPAVPTGYGDPYDPDLLEFTGIFFVS